MLAWSVRHVGELRDRGDNVTEESFRNTCTLSFKFRSLSFIISQTSTRTVCLSSRELIIPLLKIRPEFHSNYPG